MAEKINAYCTICGKGYHLCVSCGNHRLNPWKKLTDTPEHYKIHQILSGFSNGIYTKDETRDKLMNVNLSDSDTYIDSVKSLLNTVLTEEAVIESNDINTDIDVDDKVKSAGVNINGTKKKKK